MPRSWLRRHGALTAEKHHELAALDELPPDENQTIRPKGPLTSLLGHSRCFEPAIVTSGFSPDTTRIATPPPVLGRV